MTNARVVERFVENYFVVRVSSEIKLSPGDWIEIRRGDAPQRPLFSVEDPLTEFHLLADEATRSVAEAHATLERTLGVASDESSPRRRR